MSSTPKPQVCLVTGSSRGIGRDASLLLASRGHRVYASMRDPSGKNKEHAADLAKTCSVIELDVCDEATIKRAIDEIVGKEGRLDAVVNNAGYGVFGPIEETPVNTIKEMFETNFYGPLRVMQRALPVMRKQGGGVFVQVSSISGVMITPFGGPYQSSKWAFEAMSEAVAMETGHFGIRVVLLEPGNVNTDVRIIWPEAIQDGTSAYQGLREDSRAHPFSAPTMDVSVVSNAIVRGIEDPTCPMRVPLGEGFVEMVAKRRASTAEEWKEYVWESRGLSW